MEISEKILILTDIYAKLHGYLHKINAINPLKKMAINHETLRKTKIFNIS